MVTPTLQSFALRICLDEALRVSRAAQPRPDVALVVEMDSDVPPVVHTDQGMLRQILINLIGNALKFTSVGEVRVHVSAKHAARSGDLTQLSFAVTDTGIGIDLNTQQRLFQPFQQGAADGGQPAVGSGLGLVICSLLVRALGGEIEMSSEPGKGTRMTFSILAQASAMLSDHPSGQGVVPDVSEVSAPATTRTLRVMVVEDNDVNRELLGIMLEQLGHEVFAVADGEAAISACAEQAFDVVLMDLNLPRIGGIEATRRILQGYEARGDDDRPAIIALTASVSDADRTLCAAAGMHGFLTKPATVFSLDMALRVAVNDTSLPDEEISNETGEVIDLVTLDSLSELDQRAAAPFLQRLIDRFIEGLPAQVSQLLVHWEAGSHDQVVLVAHSLAGAASAVGAIALSRAARRVSDSPSAEAIARVEFAANATTSSLNAWMLQRSVARKT